MRRMPRPWPIRSILGTNGKPWLRRWGRYTEVEIMESEAWPWTGRRVPDGAMTGGDISADSNPALSGSLSKLGFQVRA